MLLVILVVIIIALSKVLWGYILSKVLPVFRFINDEIPIENVRMLLDVEMLLDDSVE